ncbi:MAG: metG [Candidatus Taylorbacteria bacterium]|nr:metG [Candidatus Taylorbacteria bacterium]
MSKKPFYITTTLPYVNARAHFGHALEFMRADIIARYKKLAGYEVFFNTGTDEHGQKLFDEAAKAGKPVQQYVDENSQAFREIVKLLGVSDDIHFIRTTDEKHVKCAQAFWNRVNERGYIYKKNYTAKYCVGCELEKKDSDLVDGRCPLHPNRELELIEEENYFFKFSAFTQPLLDLYAKNPNFVIPNSRFNEIRAFVERGLEDFSISRLKSKMSWGVPVPGDDEHVMYVWFDALTSYISTLGWPDEATVKEGGDFDRYWVHGTPTQYCGKDNLRQQTATWQAMLMAAGLPNSFQIIINGFITGEGGIKMSKSLGNVVDPLDLIKEYGADALRYYVAREVSMFEDSPFTLEAFKNSYNAGLANGVGNLVSRVVKMAETNGVRYDVPVDAAALTSLYAEHYEKFEINKVCDEIWKKIAAADRFIQEQAPFKKVKVDLAAGKADIAYLLGEVAAIGALLQPIMPETSAKIAIAIRDNTVAAPLFLRK